MAQAQERGSARAERVRLVLRQRPGYAVAAALVAAALVAAALVGVVEAGGADGVVILASDGSSEDSQASDGDAGQDAGDAAEAADDDASASETVVVDIDGAVVSPSVVELPAGSRVADAIEAAGGLTDDADVSGINRAAVLIDGEKIYIPAEGEEATSTSTSSSSTTSSTADSSGLVNINTADADELDTLPGIGPALAQAIIDDREANGAFSSIEDITRVSGIGEAKYANIKDLICV